jgi:ATP-dependent DNA ligase
LAQVLHETGTGIVLFENLTYATPAELISCDGVWLRGRHQEAQRLFLQIRQAPRRMAEIQGQQIKEFVIGRYTPGNPLDAVIVGYYDDDKLIYAAKVRNGFVPRFRREVWQKLKGLETAACPFANLPEKKRTQFSLTREEMKNCIWLKPKLVAQIEFPEWTADSHLRHSKFVALRYDKNPRQVWRE